MHQSVCTPLPGRPARCWEITQLCFLGIWALWPEAHQQQLVQDRFSRHVHPWKAPWHAEQGDVSRWPQRCARTGLGHGLDTALHFPAACAGVLTYQSAAACLLAQLGVQVVTLPLASAGIGVQQNQIAFWRSWRPNMPAVQPQGRPARARAEGGLQNSRSRQP